MEENPCTSQKETDIRPLHPVKHLLVNGHTHQRDFMPAISRLLELLRTHGISLHFTPRFSKYLLQNGITLDDNEISTKGTPAPDAAISLGGDGTFLRTCRMMGNNPVPALGINTGHLGFLASYTPDDAAELVEMLARGEGSVERRMALEVDTGCPLRPELPYALNEVAILKEDTSSMLNIGMKVNSNFLATYQADGLIVATPTGSTAYNLSVGGPILEPTLRCMVLSPIAPHSLTLRPCVVGGDSMLEAVVESRATHYRLSLDGQNILIPCGTPLTIRRARFEPMVIRRPGDSFADSLRKKLLWGVSGISEQ